jgi:CheY-like chemotaxis protein
MDLLPLSPFPNQNNLMIMFRVLIVDDDPDDRDFLRNALEKAGVEPILALSSAQEVFAYLQGIERTEDLPKLIISDLNMPDINGYELLQSLRSTSRYQHIPVVICSTSSLSTDVTRCLAAGASQYLQKPNTFRRFR